MPGFVWGTLHHTDPGFPHYLLHARILRLLIPSEVRHNVPEQMLMGTHCWAT
ncbi:mCG147773 [Mus musculus]|nr:mCG147773 [Mus musculus]